MKKKNAVRQLLLSSTALAATLAGYGRAAYGQQVCTQQGSTSTYLCSGSSTDTQDLRYDTTNIDSIQVVTGPGFSVSTVIERPLIITGHGDVSYTDLYNSYLSSDLENSFYISSFPSITYRSGSVTVKTNGTFDGDFAAYNTSDGNLAVTLYQGGSVSGGAYGIYGSNTGTTMEITVYGDVTATRSDIGEAGTGIWADNGGSGDLTITSGSNVTVQGEATGILATNDNAAVNIYAYGDVIGTNDYGIQVDNSGTDINIVTGQLSQGVTGNVGMSITNSGSGSTTITTNGNVTGTGLDGIDVSNGSGATDLTVTIGNGTTVSAEEDGILASNDGSGALTITTYGSVTSSNATGINASGYGTDLSITVGQQSTVSGSLFGIGADQSGSGTLSVKVNGDVTGQGADGIELYNGGGSAAHVMIGASGTVVSTSGGSDDFAIDIEEGAAEITVAGSVSGAGAGAIQFDQGSAHDNQLKLLPTAVVSGNVIAGPGSNDLLAFGGQGSASFDLTNIDTGGGTQQYQNFEVLDLVSGNWSFTGATTLPLTVESGRIMGNGSFGNLTMSGGTIAPGNSIGTIRTRDITFRKGATYEVEVDAAGNSDRIMASGTATINGGTVNVIAGDGDYADSTRYTILTASGGRTGTFAAVQDNLAFLTPTLSYDANSVYLTLVRTNGPNGEKSFSSVANTQNQSRVAVALDNVPTTNTLFRKVLGQSAPGARTAFDRLSGEVHAAIGGALVREGRYIRDAVMGRLVQASFAGSALGAGGPQSYAFAPANLQANMMALGYGADDLARFGPTVDRGPTFWTQGFGNWVSRDGDGNAASLKRSLGGVVSGVDAEMLPGWRVGVAGGYSYSDLDVDARASGANVDAYHLLVYGGREMGRLALRGGGAWSWQEIETSRFVGFPGFAEAQSASYDGDRGQVFGELGYALLPGGRMAMEPFAGLAYVHEETAAFTESGAQAGLSSSGYSEGVTYSTLGIRAATNMDVRGLLVSPRLEVAWLHAFDEVDTDLALAFASNGVGFEVAGTPIAQDTAVIEAGLDFSVSQTATLTVSYDGQFGDGVEEHGLKGRASWKF
ncbi:autotransporter outer membrane beta-barrel domain-containing protein [Methyloligella solikamskensis]|uniref:Autotransporter domain-containing protein n=1 Tax=Methyloligella solikamskensis TaxID=1177756 RepID=A0ABW3J6X2_9HYPH